MTFFSTFTLTFGAMLALIALMAAWLFRTASAPLAAKLVVPVLLVALACSAPFEVNSMMGLPITASVNALPEKAELVAFVSRDDDKVVDLWLRSGDTPPRSYETRLDARMKKTLREAQDEKEQGRPAFLSKRKQKVGDPSGLGDRDQTEYVLDDSVRSALPPKDEGNTE